MRRFVIASLPFSLLWASGCGPIALGDPHEERPVTDVDGDGFIGGDDCDDGDEAVNPAATEVCDEIDNDCNGDIDEAGGTTGYQDADGDSYGTKSFVDYSCTMGDGYVGNSGDCDDANPLAWTGNLEVCDGVDNNCDGGIDESAGDTWYSDLDEDGYGDDLSSAITCTAPGAGFTLVPGDCNDADATVNPAATEVCGDAADNDCDFTLDCDDGDCTADPVCQPAEGDL